MITCTRVLEFDYGHRVYKHESKCAHPHGHRGRVEITAEADQLDHLGRVVDFSVLKQKVGTWIDENWDHNFLVNRADKGMIDALNSLDDCRKPWICNWNPTAENMANYLLVEVCPNVLKGTGVRVVRVKLFETPNGIAEACL